MNSLNIKIANNEITKVKQVALNSNGIVSTVINIHCEDSEMINIEFNVTGQDETNEYVWFEENFVVPFEMSIDNFTTNKNIDKPLKTTMLNNNKEDYSKKIALFLELKSELENKNLI